MQALRINGFTRVLATNQDEYHELAIRDESIQGVEVMSSLWEPNPREMKQSINGEVIVLFGSVNGSCCALRRHLTLVEACEIAKGGRIKITIPGHIHPPVFVAICDPKDYTDYPPPNHPSCVAAVDRYREDMMV